MATDLTIQKMILTIRDQQVILDHDIAVLYEVETRIINQAVKRNTNRFPPEFCFQLSYGEFNDWRSQIVMSNEDKMGLVTNCNRLGCIDSSSFERIFSGNQKLSAALRESHPAIDKDDELVEYAMNRHLSPTLIAHYTTILHDKKILQAKLHEITQMLRETEGK